MKYCLAAALATMLTGCAVTLAPHTPYIPAISNQGEAEAKLSASPTGRQLELQLGYQATKNIILHGAFLSYRRPNSSTRFNSGDVGFGYYRTLANKQWRLGVHAGVARGSGASGDGIQYGRYDSSSSFYKVGYTYGYVQPTALFLLPDGKVSWGFGLRLGQVYYDRFDERQTSLTAKGDTVTLFSFRGHQTVFVQPTLHGTIWLRRWLAVSSDMGLQLPLGKRQSLTLMNPLSAQVSLQFIAGAKQAR